MADQNRPSATPRTVKVTSSATLQRQEVAQIGPPPNDAVSVQRATRTLIGWMHPGEATLALAGRNQGEQQRPEYADIARQARHAVAARAVGIDQSEAIVDPPESLRPYIDELRQNAASAGYFREGWVVKLADLRRICSFQPHVFTEDSSQRVRAIQEDDIAAIAGVTLPLHGPQSLAASFNPTRNAWVFSSANPNLRVVGQANGDSPIGAVFGFVIGVSGSFMQVASYHGRLLLRDGYHRAFGLISRGIHVVPVFFREFATFDELRVPEGMLPQDAYLGDRPPLLGDYLNTDVAAATTAPATQKVIVVQALEIATLG
jgi:hypothetical protein